METRDILKQGIIQSFEYTHELAWKVMKDYAEYQGNTEIKGSRDAVKYAAQVELVNNGHVWMEMMQSRNSTSHTYNESTANEIVKFILMEYEKEFVQFETKMKDLSDGASGIWLNEEKFGLSKKEILKINSVFEKFPQVQKVVIFGSRVKGNYKKYSDIDLTLIGENISQKTLYNIQLSLDDLYLPYVFDINIKEKITNSEFVDHIERVGLVFHQNNQ